MAKVGIREVAKAADVSVTTVSHALSDAHQSRVSPETREHVRRVAADLGYSPNRLASGLRNQRSYLLGLVSDQIASSPFAGEMILGAQDAAYERGWLLMLVDSGGNRELEERQIATLLQHQVDGIIYAKMFHQRIQVPAEVARVPAVLLDAVDAAGSLPGIVPDEAGAARTAMRELLDAGHTRIGYVSNSDDIPATAGRLRGYREALADAGIAYDAELVTAQHPGVAGGRAGAEVLLGLDRPPSAIFCFHDRQAFGVYEAAGRRGLSIPEDLSVVSIDNFEIIADGLWPGLTSVALPHYEMGRWAVIRLLDGIEGAGHTTQGAHDGGGEPTLAECPLVRRGSVAPPRTGRH